MTPAEFLALRLATFREIAKVVKKHNLPAPMSVMSLHHKPGIRSLNLHLDNDQREGVYLWAQYLRLPLVPDHVFEGPDGFTSVKAEKTDHVGGVWLGWQSVQVWSACYQADGEVAS